MKNKYCMKCKKRKLINKFSVSKRANDGRACYCKNCNNGILLNYRHTKNGVIATIYNKQKYSSKKRNHVPPLYSRDELKEWVFLQGIFHELFKAWEKSKFSTKLKPSVDRIDDRKPYTFENIQLMTWEENNKKSHFGNMNGNYSKITRRVVQYDLDSNFVNEYVSISKASRETGFSISGIFNSCANLTCKGRKGFIWRYANG